MVKDVTLEDDNSPYGGVSYAGETLYAFLDEVGIKRDTNIEEINNTLALCGIKQVKEEEVWKYYIPLGCKEFAKNTL
ncbi:hypothetical protein [Eubacterium oxidoreducens]|uniref:Uncharacterized protein n=1 Tax=Eubacterium oxidoreducens TaxID=1732 RepID=A0A1G6B386_EUBOX|nr:hypothetical protein [Eubacterium oxidoreducens]SDB15065.1 hypothetical protein SAMN02910417_01108 [Eubacterium oxidoreducens]